MSQEHKKALRVLMKSPVTDDMIKFLTNTTLQVLPASLPTPPTSPSDSKQQRLPSLMTFITKLVRYTNVYTSTLLTTTCYLKKLQRILPKDATGLPSTIHRMFLACLIISAKYHNDSSPLNKHWAEYTDGLFSLEDVNLMEMQLLALLNWDLRINENDLILDLRHLLEPIMRDLEISYQRKKILKSKSEQHQYIQRPVSPISPTKSYNKFYRQVSSSSIDSNMSSATLTESMSASSSRYSLAQSRSITPVSEKTPLVLNDLKTGYRSTDESWDFEQIMAQYGF
ncbi:hypothetical protein Kpol_1020p16 [Vanderwaltozyma polyspora DSM 70294]|uniref:Cyclin-like domain-containing protein n=1 Tax=Vanderwaltozyma polyspora (strain ATCC 22028 / DSM 70294 / BCRC 21397 / CBS 2163 / NBRC 10782 / NRRL Y-8283 / UCD 57-17) TaxID=436907 RepID=A7TLC7_VANPO|nr:uncharacterized protein Kpol_1020p16 [Vanderwaltozyma polyspora DSM 70294]EDO16908.1 hypothetical protein Kpol_1020p16 [Vanderwaltozyma polyspora DSM 70294]